MPLFEITKDSLRDIPATGFDAAHLRERADLQRLLRDRIDVISPDTLVIAEEFCDWEDSKRRIDLLGLDKSGSLVVIELKRVDDGTCMDLQAIRYAAMVSTMTFDQVVAAYSNYLSRRGLPGDAKQIILGFLGWDDPEKEQFAQDVRIVLAAADFSKELTTAVMWLNQRDLDIQCVRIRPHLDNGRVLLDVQQVIPLPEAEEYQIRVRAKATEERAARMEHGTGAERYRRFWTGLLNTARQSTSLHRDVSAPATSWVGAQAHGHAFNYAFNRHGTPRVELWISRPDAAENKALFHALRRDAQTIEAAFGEPLAWDEMPDNVASRISATVEGPSITNEAEWPALQSAMIAAMTRLANALGPKIDAYRRETTISKAS